MAVYVGVSSDLLLSFERKRGSRNHRRALRLKVFRFWAVERLSAVGKDCGPDSAPDTNFACTADFAVCFDCFKSGDERLPVGLSSCCGLLLILAASRDKAAVEAEDLCEDMTGWLGACPSRTDLSSNKSAELTAGARKRPYEEEGRELEWAESGRIHWDNMARPSMAEDGRWGASCDSGDIKRGESIRLERILEALEMRLPFWLKLCKQRVKLITQRFLYKR